MNADIYTAEYINQLVDDEIKRRKQEKSLICKIKQKADSAKLKIVKDMVIKAGGFEVETPDGTKLLCIEL